MASATAPLHHSISKHKTMSYVIADSQNKLHTDCHAPTVQSSQLRATILSEEDLARPLLNARACNTDCSSLFIATHAFSAYMHTLHILLLPHSFALSSLSCISFGFAVLEITETLRLPFPFVYFRRQTYITIMIIALRPTAFLTVHHE